MSTISYCLLANNDLPWLRVTIPYALKWADQICIMDMGSTDGTREFLKMILRPCDVVVFLDENIAPREGFAACVNTVCDIATCDWILRMDPDMMVRPCDVDKLRASTEPGCPFSFNLSDSAVLTQEKWMFATGATPERMEWAMAHLPLPMIEQPHVLLYRRDAGLKWRGYLHEALHRGDTNCFDYAQRIPVRVWHFSNWHQNELRAYTYHWMISQMMKRPELQDAYDRDRHSTFYNNNRDLIEGHARKYEELLKSK